MRRTRLAPQIAAIACAMCLVTLVVVPLAAPERDVLRSHPEHYVDTAMGALVRLGYLAVAVTMSAIVTIVWRGRGPARYAAALLAAVAACTTLVLSVAPVEITGGPLLVGLFALVLTPAAASLASARVLPVGQRILGVVVTVSFIVFAIESSEISGLINRAWDALLGVWGVAFAISARRTR